MTHSFVRTAVIHRPKAQRPAGAARGFSLMELLVSVAIMLLITGAIFSQIAQMQKKESSEGLKLDLTQEAREFLDQTVRDLHMAGYPKPAMFLGGTLPNTSALVAAGLVRVSPTDILMEGDVNTEGAVYSVKISYVASDPNDPKCPCIRRNPMRKQDNTAPWLQPAAPNYTETEQVYPPGTGANQSGENLFTYFDQNGNAINIPALGVDISTAAGQATIKQIKTIKINLSLHSQQADMATGQLVRTSMSAIAKLN